MNLYDPARPLTIHRQRMMLSGGLVPTWYIIPAIEGSIKIMAFFLTSGVTSYRDFSFSILAYEFPAFWSEWMESPEAFAAHYFNYHGPASASPSASASLTEGNKPPSISKTLEELGL